MILGSRACSWAWAISRYRRIHLSEWRPRAGFGRTKISDGFAEYVVARGLDPRLADSESCSRLNHERDLHRGSDAHRNAGARVIRNRLGGILTKSVVALIFGSRADRRRHFFLDCLLMMRILSDAICAGSASASATTGRGFIRDAGYCRWLRWWQRGGGSYACAARGNLSSPGWSRRQASKQFAQGSGEGTAKRRQARQLTLKASQNRHRRAVVRQSWIILSSSFFLRRDNR